MRRGGLVGLALLAASVFVLVSFAVDQERSAKAADDGFVSIFDGRTLKGWHVSSQTGHSATSKNKSGGRWVVKDRAIVGSQDIPGNGGIIITDKHYGDFEIVLEMNNDFGPDSMDFTDKEKRHADKGGIALQVHGGGDSTKEFVRYRKIRVKTLD